MGRPTNSTRAYRVAADLENWATDNSPDYRDAFEVQVLSTDTRTPELWARAVFERAPRLVRWFLLLGWRWVLGLQLGPRSSLDHVLGWRITSKETDAIHLELRSTLMTAQLILRVASSTAVLTTHVSYTQRLAHPLWTAVGLIHRQMVPYLLGRAASCPRRATS
ncbi:DUF2867 domain-containing protein [Ktedonobacter robiniae]|uniref:DUF2867 domain-containing protein n=1 Tax=Ktedonobacter robiniae TaxID=2778365 RepID=A0ABQ3UYJ9_9CHLR|nr:DUF2867 domain-containing protein [Ktedonobacter robiniae]GHO57632.1 hypothetical protein KSB_61070 [Ktedonobacter robiniae]